MSIVRKLLVTAFLPALVVFLLSGCGEEKAAAPAKTSTKASTSKSSTAAAGKDRPESLIDQIVVPTEQSPQDFKKSLENRRAVVVTFYLSGPSDDSQVRSSINKLESRFKGQADFYTFLYTDGQKYGDLNIVLRVNTTPTVVIINKQAKVQRAWTGYADEESIEQGIVEATSQ